MPGPLEKNAAAKEGAAPTDEAAKPEEPPRRATLADLGKFLPEHNT